MMFLFELVFLFIGFALYSAARATVAKKLGEDITGDIADDIAIPVASALLRCRARVYTSVASGKAIASTVFDPPRLYILVDGNLNALSGPTRSFVIAHEISHFKTRDPALALAFQYIGAMAIGSSSFWLTARYGLLSGVVWFVLTFVLGLVVSIKFSEHRERRADAFGASLVGPRVASNALSELRNFAAAATPGKSSLARLNARLMAMEKMAAHQEVA